MMRHTADAMLKVVLRKAQLCASLSCIRYTFAALFFHNPFDFDVASLVCHITSTHLLA